MLNQDTITKLKALHPKLWEAIEAPEEVAFTFPEGAFYTDAHIEEMKENVKSGYAQAYPEIYGKDLNTKYELGLSTSDAKNPEKLMAALKKKAITDAGIEPSKKVAELEASIKKLQEETIPEYEQKAQGWEKKYKEREEYDQYAAHIPENANKFLTKEEHVARVKKLVGIGEAGIAIDPSTGTAYKDKLEKPILFKDKVAELYSGNDGWMQPETPAPTPRMNHSTIGNPNRKVGAFDHDGTYQKLSEQYDKTTPEGRAAIQKGMTAAMIENAKVA